MKLIFACHGYPGFLKIPSFSSFFEINYSLLGQVLPRLTHFSFTDDDAFPHERNRCISFLPLSLVASPPFLRMLLVVGKTKGPRFPQTCTQEHRTPSSLHLSFSLTLVDNPFIPPSHLSPCDLVCSVLDTIAKSICHSGGDLIALRSPSKWYFAPTTHKPASPAAAAASAVPPLTINFHLLQSDF